jgi:hypothetical protein
VVGVGVFVGVRSRPHEGRYSEVLWELGNNEPEVLWLVRRIQYEKKRKKRKRATSEELAPQCCCKAGCLDRSAVHLGRNRLLVFDYQTDLGVSIALSQ